MRNDKLHRVLAADNHSLAAVISPHRFSGLDTDYLGLHIIYRLVLFCIPYARLEEAQWRSSYDSAQRYEGIGFGFGLG